MTGNLPAPLSTFVNRRSEITELSRLMSDARLVTLTGPAGVGKTRLAVRVASRLGRRFPDGVWLVELAHLGDEDLLVHTIAHTVGIHDTAGHPLDALIEYLATRRLLLVLDNCEHLLDACTWLAAIVLDSTEASHVLATSREALRVPGGHEVRMSPLDVESPVGVGHAVELFADRAAAATSTFAVTADNRADVTDLCRRLDGIPLAIELAAVRLRALSVRQLRERLDDRFRLLDVRLHGGTAHRRTLRRAVDWSFELCDPAERRLWQCLSLFAGGFDQDGAAAVAAAAGAGARDTADELDRLVAKSVVQRDGLRFELLETLRDYGRDRLRESGDEPAVARAFIRHYLNLAEQAERHWFGPGQLDWFRRLEREHDNLRAAVDLLLADHDTEAAQRLCGALWFHWLFSGRLAEGRWWLDRTLRLGPAPTQARAKALVADAFLAGVEGDLDEAAAAGTEALRLAETFGDLLAAAAALARLASAATSRGDRAAARDFVTRSLGRYAAAGAADCPESVYPRNMLIWVLAQDGDLEAAAEAGERSVAICRDWGDETVLGATLVHLARARWVDGDVDGAAAAVREAILLRRSMPVPTTLARGIELLAWTVAARDGRGDGERAAVLLGAGDRIWREFGLTKLLRTPMYAGPHSECESRVRADIGDEAFSTAFHRGAGVSIDEIIDYVAGKPSPTRQPTTADDPRDLLTRREREVAELLATGLTNHQIAESLVISRRTAESHVLRIMTKFGVTSRTRIAVAADPAQGRGPQPAQRRRGAGRGHRCVPARIVRGTARARRGVRPGHDLGDRLRPVHGLRGVPARPDARGLAPAARPGRGDRRGYGHHRPGGHRGRRHHGGRLRIVPAQSGPDAAAVRPRPGRRGAARRRDHPLPGGAGRDAAVRPVGLVAAAGAGPAHARGRPRTSLTGRVPAAPGTEGSGNPDRNGPDQNGNCAGWLRTVSQRVSVNASMLAWAPPKREPVPEAPVPPKGAFASSFTVWSLMCTMPVGILSASSTARIASRVTMPSDRPYSVAVASAMASSMLPYRATGATGPKISLAKAGVDAETPASTVGW